MGTRAAVHRVPAHGVPAHGVAAHGVAVVRRWRTLLVVVLAAALTVATPWAPHPPRAVAAGAAVTLAVSAPVRATAGSAFSITVTARDAAGAVASSYRGRVRFTSTDTRAPVLPAAYTFTAADAGRRTFTGVRLVTAGSRTIAAFDTVRATVKGRSGPIAVAPGKASRLTVGAPSTATAGVGTSVRVTARDAWSNVATGYRGTVRLTSSDPGRETLPPPHTFTAADGGTRVLPGVVLVSAGSRTVSATDTVVATLTGRSAAIAVAPRHALYVWDASGQSFPGHYPTSPTLLGPETRWLRTAATGHNLAIRSDRTLWTWGSDLHGQLGDGVPGEEFRSTPQRVGTRADWAAVAAGEGYSLAVKRNGTLWAWGENVEGQLGDGTRTDRARPVQVGAGVAWRSVAASSIFSAGVSTSGTLWLWGGEHPPEHPGDIDRVGSVVPVQVGTDGDWASVSLGQGHVLALRTDGSLWAWGENTLGQLGTGPASGVAAPVRVGTATWASVEAGEYRSFGIQRDGTLWAWGLNFAQELGGGAAPYQPTPVQIGVGSTWRSVSDGTASTVAVRSDGTLWVWGEGRPMTRVGTSGGWVAATSGGVQVLGLRSTITTP